MAEFTGSLEQERRRRWFGENFEFIAATTGILQETWGGSVAGEEKYFAARQEFKDANCRLNAVHVGHENVADDEIGIFPSRALDGFASVISGKGIEAVPVQNDDQSVGNQVLIIDYKHPLFSLTRSRISALGTLRLV